MRIKPFHDNIAVVPILEETTTSGFQIAIDGEKKKTKCKVIAVGPGKWESGIMRPMSVSVGDTVYISNFARTELQIEGQEVYICEEQAVLAKIENE